MTTHLLLNDQIRGYQRAKWGFGITAIGLTTLSLAFLAGDIAESFKYSSLSDVSGALGSSSFASGILALYFLYAKRGSLKKLKNLIPEPHLVKGTPKLDDKEPQKAIVCPPHPLLDLLGPARASLFSFLDFKDSFALARTKKSTLSWRREIYVVWGQYFVKSSQMETTGVAFIHGLAYLKARALAANFSAETLKEASTQTVVTLFAQFKSSHLLPETQELISLFMLPYAVTKKTPLPDQAAAEKRLAVFDRVIRQGLVNGCRLFLAHDTPIETPVLPDLPSPPLIAAVESGQRAVLKVLLESHTASQVKKIVDAHGNTALHRAAFKGDLVSANDLITHGADLRAYNEQLQSPLHIAAREGNVPMSKFLIVRGTPVDLFTKTIRNAYGQESTALYLAAERGHGAVVKMLLSQGASLSSENYNRRSPLMGAVCSGQIACVHLILNALTQEGKLGASINAIDRDRNTALILAAERGFWDIARLLLQSGADRNIANVLGQTATETYHLV